MARSHSFGCYEPCMCRSLQYTVVFGGPFVLMLNTCLHHTHTHTDSLCVSLCLYFSFCLSISLSPREAEVLGPLVLECFSPGHVQLQLHNYNNTQLCQPYTATTVQKSCKRKNRPTMQKGPLSVVRRTKWLRFRKQSAICHYHAPNYNCTRCRQLW